MGQHASIVMNDREPISLEIIYKYIDYYKGITAKTGEQLGWEYSETAFPYEICQEHERLLILRSVQPGFNHIYIGIIQSEDESAEAVQIYLPASSAHGDKGKANELCKFLAKKMKGELHLFNGKVMRFT
ncbi:DUF1885 family protein [Bacillus sp. SJS]|uniref:DUF1885 family protein n=1 Tax=Bacillus sp. SJS TaxID=1423321 RepID=UPI000689745B|nr:DUF1885 family protein [Bacillus sp. SJS]KZZ83011.1 hypothetical protein AS29_019665 [Bacillus sp. SJS]